MVLFMDVVHVSETYRAATRTQFTFSTKSPGRPSTYLIDLDG